MHPHNCTWTFTLHSESIYKQKYNKKRNKERIHLVVAQIFHLIPKSKLDPSRLTPPSIFLKVHLNDLSRMSKNSVDLRKNSLSIRFSGIQ